MRDLLLIWPCDCFWCWCSSLAWWCSLQGWDHSRFLLLSSASVLHCSMERWWVIIGSSVPTLIALSLYILFYCFKIYRLFWLVSCLPILGYCLPGFIYDPPAYAFHLVSFQSMKWIFELKKRGEKEITQKGNRKII